MNSAFNPDFVANELENWLQPEDEQDELEEETYTVQEYFQKFGKIISGYEACPCCGSPKRSYFKTCLNSGCWYEEVKK